MFTVSSEFKSKIYGNRPALAVKADLTLANGTTLYLDYEDSDADFMSQGMSLEDAVSNPDTFDVGSAIMNYFYFSLNNYDKRYTDTSFAGAKIVPYMGIPLANGSTEWVKKGVFNVTECTVGGVMKFKSYDNMVELETPFADVVVEYPVTLQRLAQVICNHCGVILATSNIPNGSYEVASAPIGTEYTCRQIIAYIAQIAGCFARFNRDGELEIKWYSDTVQHEIPTYKYLQPGLREMTVTGVQVSSYYNEESVSDKGEALENIQTVLNGEEGYVLSLGENPLIPYGYADDVAEYLGNKLIGTTFRPLELSTLYDPSMEAGDCASVEDRDGNVHVFFVANLSVNINSYVKISCGAGGEDEYSNGQYTDSTAAKIKFLDIVNAKFRKLVVDTLEAKYATIKQLEAEAAKIGKVYVQSVDDDGGTLLTVINENSMWEATYVDKNGTVISGLTFDFTNKKFKFDGAGSFSGELNIGNGNFIVDANGNVTAYGDTKIYGGKYYAMDDEDNTGGYTTMDKDGYSVYSNDGVQRIKIGFPAGHPDSPYISLNGGTSSNPATTIVKNFTDGMWIGNNAPANAYGAFEPLEGYNGIFVSSEDGNTYVVSDTSMQAVYTGEVVARFG